MGRLFYPASASTGTHKLANWLMHPQYARGAPRPGTPGDLGVHIHRAGSSARQPVLRTLRTSPTLRGRLSGAPARNRLRRLCHGLD